MKGVYLLEENWNLTFIRRVDDDDIGAPIRAVAEYLKKCLLDCNEIKAMSGGKIMKAAGMKFYIIKLSQ